MRILLLSNLYPPYVLGGAEILARDYVINLEELGHEVVVLTSSYGLPSAQQDGNIWRTLHSFRSFWRDQLIAQRICCHSSFLNGDLTIPSR